MLCYFIYFVLILVHARDKNLVVLEDNKKLKAKTSLPGFSFLF